MTMNLPNSDLHPRAAEIAEFIEAHHAGQPGDRALAEPGARTAHRAVPTAQLDPQTRIGITHRAEEYISGLVDNHHGDRDDVRAVIHDLHDQSTFTHHDVGR